MVTATADRTFLGIGLASAGYACFALQDAVVKLLVASYEGPHSLHAKHHHCDRDGRSCWHFRHPFIFKSQHKGTVVLHAALILKEKV